MICFLTNLVMIKIQTVQDYFFLLVLKTIDESELCEVLETLSQSTEDDI